MKITKNTSVLLVIILTINLLCSCGTKPDTSAADTYLSMAEDFVAQENYSAAIDILQKGFSETKDERIAVMIAEITSKNTDSNNQSAPTTPSSSESSSPSAPTLPNNTESTSTTEATTAIKDTSVFKSYAGIWAEENIGWQNGGMIMDVECTSESITIILSYTQGAPTSRIAEITIEEKLSAIKDRVLVAELVEDGWGNKNTVQINFSKSDIIQCRIVKVVADESAMWGFYEDEFTLYRNSNAHSSMSYTMEDYYAIHPEEQPSTAPTYDTSKASGILKDLGLTEAEFRQSCTRLFPSNFQIGNPDGTELYYSDLFEYPNKYINSWFVIDNLAAEDFQCTYKSTSTDGYICYMDTDYYDGDAILFDFRDDPYSPNIREGDVITPYVIFKGLSTTNAGEVLVFLMISMDK